MKLFLRIIVGLTLLVQANFCLADAEEIKIGFMCPLTGSQSGEAKNLTDALKLAIKEVNAAGGIKGQKLSFVIEDTASTPNSAVEAYEKLIKRDDIVAVIGPIKSAQIVPLIPLGLNAKVPTIIGGSTPSLTDQGQFIIRTRPSDQVVAEAMVKYLKEETAYTDIGIIHDDGAFGATGANLVTRFAGERGLKIVSRMGFRIGEEKNFKPYVKKVSESGAQVMLVYVSDLNESSEIIKEYAKLKTKMVYFGTSSSHAPITLNKAKESAEGTLAIMDMILGETPESKKYSQVYKKEYGEEATARGAYTYDGIKLLARAMSEVGPDKTKIRDAILKIKNYKGVMGIYNFNSKGEGLNSVLVQKILKGKPKLLKIMTIDQPQ